MLGERTTARLDPFLSQQISQVLDRNERSPQSNRRPTRSSASEESLSRVFNDQPRDIYFNIQPFRVEYRYNICRYFTRKGFEYLVYYIGYSLRGTTVSVVTYPLTMRSIRGGTLGWNIEIYSTPTNQFDWSVSRAYVINIYIIY